MFENFINLTESACSLGYTAGIEIFSLEIRWYALSYIIGLLLGQRYIYFILKFNVKKPIIEAKFIENFLLWAIIGILIGGRIGYIIFYNLEYYLNNLSKIFYLWEGGMSFHGGLIGISTAIIIFCLKSKLKILSMCDLIAIAAPIGIFFGRITNFLNGELWGRPSELPWAIKFSKCAGNIYRHPSQLYEAFLEGILLFFILYFCTIKLKFIDSPGKLTGLFCILYSLFRIFSEFFREPDDQLGFIFHNLTMGMLLSTPIFLIGLILIIKSKMKRL